MDGTQSLNSLTISGAVIGAVCGLFLALMFAHRARRENFGSRLILVLLTLSPKTDLNVTAAEVVTDLGPSPLEPDKFCFVPAWSVSAVHAGSAQ